MPRVLVIDDDAHIRHMMRLPLDAAGYEVGDAADGLRGLERCGADAVWDVVLLDQKMPGIDGIETLRRLRERAPATRVIMVTAFASIELAVEAMQLGATDFVRKPMTPDTLRQTVAAALAKPPVATPVGRPASPTRPQRPRIETVTMNGFHLVRTSAKDRMTAAHPGVYHFRVQDPTGQEQDVVVQVDASAVAMVERVLRRPLPLTSSFWQSYAEHTLATHVWDEGRVNGDFHLPATSVQRHDPLGGKYRRRQRGKNQHPTGQQQALRFRCAFFMSLPAFLSGTIGVFCGQAIGVHAAPHLMPAARGWSTTGSVRSVAIFWRFKAVHSSNGSPAASFKTTLNGLSRTMSAAPAGVPYSCLGTAHSPGGPRRHHRERG